MLERIAIGLTLALVASRYALVAPALLYLLQFIMVAVVRPYSERKDIARVLANLIISIAIIAIFLYLSFMTYQEIQTSPMAFYLPMIVVCIILISVLYNLIFFIHHLVTTIKLEREK